MLKIMKHIIHIEKNIKQLENIKSDVVLKTTIF